MDKILDLIKKEERRQREELQLIPSENYTYPEVREVVGSVLMQKYAEGLPGKRYYQGNEFVDEIESYCQEQALKAFSLKKGDWGVNVQPYSGSPANLAVYNALLNPGDKIMAMYLPEGGHLSHGWHVVDQKVEGSGKVTLVSKIYDVSFYHVDPATNTFNYGQIGELTGKVKPKLIISGGTAYPREIDYQKLSNIAKSIKAYYLADVAHEAGLIAGGVNESPFPFADVVTMTTHKTLRGPRGALIFARRQLMEVINKSVFPGIQGGPHLHSIAGMAVALEKTQHSEFKQYAKQVVVNAQRLAENFKNLGFTVVSGGTDKHLVLLDLRNKRVNGWFAAWALEGAGIIVNRNMVPGETGSPYYPSGIRLGTPAVTVRGMKEPEMDQICEWIDSVVRYLGVKEVPKMPEIRDLYLKKFKADLAKDTFLAEVKKRVRIFCKKYPVS